jgi:hypothetical protein
MRQLAAPNRPCTKEEHPPYRSSPLDCMRERQAIRRKSRVKAFNVDTDVNFEARRKRQSLHELASRDVMLVLLVLAGRGVLLVLRALLLLQALLSLVEVQLTFPRGNAGEPQASSHRSRDRLRPVDRCRLDDGATHGVDTRDTHVRNEGNIDHLDDAAGREALQQSEAAPVARREVVTRIEVKPDESLLLVRGKFGAVAFGGARGSSNISSSENASNIDCSGSGTEARPRRFDTTI